MDERQATVAGETEPKTRRKRRIPFFGCLLLVAAIALIVYGLYRYLISLGSAASFSL
jgi:accessory gene regulator protein AgrB